MWPPNSSGSTGRGAQVAAWLPLAQTLWLGGLISGAGAGIAASSNTWPWLCTPSLGRRHRCRAHGPRTSCRDHLLLTHFGSGTPSHVGSKLTVTDSPGLAGTSLLLPTSVLTTLRRCH